MQEFQAEDLVEFTTATKTERKPQASMRPAPISQLTPGIISVSRTPEMKMGKRPTQQNISASDTFYTEDINGQRETLQSTVAKSYSKIARNFDSIDSSSFVWDSSDGHTASQIEEIFGKLSISTAALNPGEQPPPFESSTAASRSVSGRQKPQMIPPPFQQESAPKTPISPNKSVQFSIASGSTIDSSVIGDSVVSEGSGREDLSGLGSATTVSTMRF